MSLHLELLHDGPPLDFKAEIPVGAITALVGPSGSGKTSILRAAAGLFRLRQARVQFEETCWCDSSRGIDLPTRERPIGLVSQHYALFPHLSVLGNVETALLHLPPGERTAQALRCLELAHIAGLESRYPRELSGGQRQRVALARAIARQPRLLLLDEPFSSVDRSTRKRLYVEMRRLHQQLRTTILMVTHDLDEAAQLASHLILIRHGRCLQSGATAEVLTRPGSEEAARMLDIANIFEAVAEPSASGRTMQLHWGPHRLRASNVPVSTTPRRIKFAVLPQNVLLVRTDKPWDSDLENPLPAVVDELLEMGGETLLWLRLTGINDARVQMRLPERAMRRYSVAVGKDVTVCIRAGDIVALGESVTVVS